MAWLGSHTSAIANGRKSSYYVKELLKTAGWVVRASGDGTSTYSTSSDIITSANTGANGIDNASSWFVMYKDCPLTEQRREFSWQNSSTSGSIAVFDSHTAGFVGGSPSATRRPSATDEQAVKGGGTDAAPSYQSWNVAAPTGDTLHVLAHEESASFYSMSTRDDWSAYGSAVIGLDILKVSDSDPDPYVWFRQINSARWSAPNQDRTNYIGWQGRGTANEAWKVFGVGSGGYRGIAHDCGDNPWTGAKQIFPLTVADAYASPGSSTSVFKGHSRVWRLSGHFATASSQDDRTLTCLNVEGTRDWMIHRGRAMPWDGVAVTGANADSLGEYIYFDLGTTTYVTSPPTATPPTPTRTRGALAAKAPTLKKVPRIPPGKDPALTVAIEPIRTTLNQVLDIPIMQSRVLSGVDLDDGVEAEIPHSLGRKPVGVIPFNIRGALSTESGGRIDTIPQRNETRSVVLRATGHGATITVDLLVF